jgi:acyl-CoA dehydrogenase
MDFNISEKMKTILGMIDEFVDQELIPLEPEFLTKPARSMMPVLEEKRKMVRQMELWAPNHPQEYGGMGLDLLDHALVSEALGRSPLGHYVFGCQAPDAGNIEILHQFGSEEQKKKYLKPLVDGRIRSCFSMTEVELPGSNPVMMDTTAVKDGDDYVINGQKWYTSSADGAEFAIVMAVTNPEAGPYLQASMIIVPNDTPGFNLVRNIPVMGHAGEDYFSHAEILYQNCRVPQKNLLGPEGHGFVIAQERLGPGRIHHCMRWIGICNRAFDLMVARTRDRMIAPDRKLAS